MKPRLLVIDDGLWGCFYGATRTGIGETPLGAYYDWLRRLGIMYA